MEDPRFSRKINRSSGNQWPGWVVREGTGEPTSNNPVEAGDVRPIDISIRHHTHVSLHGQCLRGLSAWTAAHALRTGMPREDGAEQRLSGVWLLDMNVVIPCMACPRSVFMVAAELPSNPDSDTESR